MSLEVAAGSIHGIVGENGAGKSTLMSILYGFYRADSGTIEVAGRPASIASPRDAIAAGIGMVHQHFMLVEPLTVLENVLLGAEGAALLQRGLRRARDTLTHLAREYRLEVDVDAPVGDLPVGIQQRVEILKALYRGAETLILDEPTGVLTPQEADELFRILAALRGTGPDHDPDHPQAARDHGRHRPRDGDARRRGGGPRGHRGDLAGAPGRAHGGPRGAAAGGEEPRHARRGDAGPTTWTTPTPPACAACGT